ncbi:hypothetical protein ACJX0J_041916, partial [Zea mays]
DLGELSDGATGIKVERSERARWRAESRAREKLGATKFEQRRETAVENKGATGSLGKGSRAIGSQIQMSAMNRRTGRHPRRPVAHYLVENTAVACKEEVGHPAPRSSSCRKRVGAAMASWEWKGALAGRCGDECAHGRDRKKKPSAMGETPAGARARWSMQGRGAEHQRWRNGWGRDSAELGVGRNAGEEETQEGGRSREKSSAGCHEKQAWQGACARLEIRLFEKNL